MLGRGTAAAPASVPFASTARKDSSTAATRAGGERPEQLIARHVLQDADSSH